MPSGLKHKRGAKSIKRRGGLLTIVDKQPKGNVENVKHREWLFDPNRWRTWESWKNSGHKEGLIDFNELKT